MNDAEIEAYLRKMLDDLVARIEIVFVPDKSDPFNLNKTMVWFITDPGPYEDMFIKLDLPSGSKNR